MKNTSLLLKQTLIEAINVMLLSTLLTACKVSPAPISAELTPISEPQVFDKASYITATSIQELTDKSTIVVIGKAVSTGDVINLAREINDLSKPDPNLFSIGQIYEFEVTRYLKGEQDGTGAKMIYVVQFEGMISLASQTPPSADDIEKARAQEKYIPINLGGEYILFLEPLKGFSELKEDYTGVAHPWRFALVDNCAFPESPWQGSSLYFHPQPIDEFVKQIESPNVKSDETTNPLAYPSPSDVSSSATCPLEPSGAYPSPYP